MVYSQKIDPSSGDESNHDYQCALQTAHESSKVKQMYVLWADVTGHGKAILAPEGAVSGDPIRRRINRLERAAQSCLGKIINRTPLGLLATFDTADAAVRGAREMQKHCALIPQISGARLGIQIGIDVANVEHSSDDLFALTEMHACRLASLLGEGSIIVASPVVEALSASMRQDIYPISHPGAQAFNWQGLPLLTESLPPVVPDGPANTRQPKLGISLRLAGKTFHFDGSHTPITIGRDPSCEIVVPHRKASRQHCRLLLENDACSLVDMSTNCTYVTSSEGVEQRGGEP